MPGSDTRSNKLSVTTCDAMDGDNQLSECDKLLKGDTPTSVTTVTCHGMTIVDPTDCTPHKNNLTYDRSITISQLLAKVTETSNLSCTQCDQLL